MPILAPYKVASREVQPEPTVVRAGSLVVGGGTVGVIAGPCSVESREQIVATARAVKEAGATGLRGGAFKPRTSPYSFQGMKEKGLELLAEAREATGLAIVTEVVAPEDVPLVARYADVLQVGARNMQNYRLLEAVGRTTTPVLLKRGPAATVEELLLAAEYILDAGNRQVRVGPAGADSARGRANEGRRRRGAEDRGGQVGPLNIHQQMGAQPDALEAPPVGAQRDLVFGTAVEEIEDPAREPSAGQLAQVLDRVRVGDAHQGVAEAEGPNLMSGKAARTPAPPSTAITSPVMCALRSEARKSSGPAISAGVAARPMGMTLPIADQASSPSR
jgi:hypothetical protein